MENNSLDEEYRRLLRRGDEERERLLAERAAHVPESRPGPLPQWPADKDHMKVTEAALLLEAGYPAAPFVKPNDGALRSEISKVYRGVVDVAGDIVRFARASLIDLIHPTLGRSAFPDEADADYIIGPEAFEAVRNWIGNGAKPTALPEPAVIDATVPPNEADGDDLKDAAPNKRGPASKKRTEATARMIEAVRNGEMTASQLRCMKQKELEKLYPDGKRTMLVKAREEALKILRQNSDKTPTNDK
jgi:hypothetical protein